MSTAAVRREKRTARHQRVRLKVKGTPARPRLNVFRSLRYVYAQIIDDSTGRTLAAVSSAKLPQASQSTPGTKTQAARQVGAEIARRAQAAGITSVVFDRGGYKYQGRIKALADSAREGGLAF